jgi:uncharacterized membrane protein
MTKGRLEAFSDGVIAILITIMVLEFRIPSGTGWTDLRPLLPTGFAYVLSFIFLGIYWTNHHHMLHLTDRINGAILWANLHLLFWLSLVPFVTAWMGENHAAPVPTVLYGVDLLMNGIAYTILEQTIIRAQGRDSKLKAAVGKDIKGYASVVFYIIGIPIAFVYPRIAVTVFAAVALMWLVPDRRIESRFYAE